MNQMGDGTDLGGGSGELTMFRRQHPGSQQPLSLMRIDATPNRKSSSPTNTDNLLTIRILETSERKMQLLKKLLTPEEYNSIATDLFADGNDIRAELASSGRIGSRTAQNHPQTTSSHRRLFGDVEKSHVNSAPLQFDNIQTKLKESTTRFSRQLSKSESNLASRYSAAPPTDLHENLAQKRKALEFFFQEPPERIPRNLGADLAIELRSGHYLSLAELGFKEKMIRGGYFGWLDRLNGLLGLIGLSLPDFRGVDNDSDDDETGTTNAAAAAGTDYAELFVKYHQQLNCEPYTRRRNLEVARKRLEADNQFAKIKLKIRSESSAKRASPEDATDGKETATTRSSRRAVCSNLIDLAKMQRSHALSSRRLLNSGQQFQVVQAIGHFNMIHLAGPKEFSQMIRDQPIEMYDLLSSGGSLSQLKERKDLRELSPPMQPATRERRPRGSLRSRLRLNLLALRFKDHSMMLAEERVAFKLLEARDRMLRLKSELFVVSSRLTRLVETHATQLTLGRTTTRNCPLDNDDQSINASEPELLSLLTRVGKMFEIRLQTIVNLKAAQDELLSVSNELDSLRREQGFNSSQVRVITKRPNSAERGESELIKEALAKLARSLAETSSNTNQHRNDPSLVALERVSKDIHEYQKLLCEEGQIWGDRQQQLDVEVQEFGLDLTPNGECPSEEVQRRRDVKSLLRSLAVKLLIGEQYKYDCSNPLEGRRDSSPAGAFSLDLRENQPTLPLPPMAAGADNDFSAQQQHQVALKIVVYTKGRRFVPFSRRLVGVGESKLPLDFRDAGSHSVSVKFGDAGDASDQSKGEARFEFLTTFIHHHAHARRDEDERQFHFEKLVNSLFSLTLNASHYRLDDLNTKLAKLANRVDPSLLLAWIAKPPPGKSAWGSYFALDPFEARLLPVSMADDEFAREFGQDQQVGQARRQRHQASSVRDALLLWRWVNNLANQTIYLSERENIQAFSLQVCEQELRSSWLAKTEGGGRAIGGELAGYKSIERARVLAAELLKRFELRLLEVLKSNRELEMLAGASSLGSGASRTAARLADLLREPELRVKFPDLFQMARRMAPRRRANRPLMRKCKSRRLSWAAAAHAADELDKSAPALDLEGQVFGHWQRLTSAHKSLACVAGLQLVVTIQQASNVPMRVISGPSLLQQQQQLAGGAASPTASFLSLVQQAGGSMQAPQSNYALAPPTTYVEIVFQRKQQASSLAQGKNPSWNETLFFPVDVARFQQQPVAAGGGGGGEFAAASVSQQQQQQLVDEFLQLNLYDYNCYLHADSLAGAGAGGSMLSTLPLVSASPDQQLSWLSQAPGAPAGDPALRGSQILASRQRVERHLLGSLRVPLSTLLSSGRIEGAFALSQPLFLDNYQFERDRAPLLGGVAGGRQGAASPLGLRSASCETHISLFITLDPPPVSFAPQLYLPIGAYESATVFEYARLWEQVVSQHRNYAAARANTSGGGGKRRQLTGRSARLQPSRHIRALVLHQDAKYCLASRLLTPLRPPRELLAQVRERLSAEQADREQRQKESQQQQQRELLLSPTSPSPTLPTAQGQQQVVASEMRALARFVSLLRPLKYGLFSMRQLASSGGLWFDSGQLVNNSLGGHEEKAVLLANYFLHLGKCSAILLGDAIPEGRCVYVVVWHEQSRFFEDKLQLQALELLSAGAGSGRSHATRAGPDDELGLHHQAPVEQQQFIARLPILVNSRSVQLWDPASGKAYWLSDQLPLISVGSIITMENVYANIQSTEKPSETNYDIRSKNFWFPLFETSSAGQMSPSQAAASGPAGAAGGTTSSGGQQQLATMRAAFDKKRAQQVSWRRQLSRLETMRKSVGRPPIRPVICEQSIEFNYEQLSDSQCRELRDSVEQVVKAHLLKWRPNRPTYFNRTLSRLLGEKLALCEHLCLASLSNDEPQQDWQTELANLIRDKVLVAHLSSPSGLSSRKIVSWPMNLPYTSMKSILDSLFASGVHNADLILADSSGGQTGRAGQSSSTQFLVACHVHAYPAKVASVWLYVAAVLTSTRQSQRLLLT